ncbi:hypothetical protein [Shinella sp.]|uniref:hypothetical protein n=1 Tax=Shinella sp. TaxID=1870904 RepID=UPI00258CBB7F|nr:hypothetical protein [Shinella sp.]MCW5706107.1 hypothetical protein [Shinella sp.]
MSSITLKVPVANGPEFVKSLTWRKIRLGDYPYLMQAAGSMAQGQMGAFSDDLLNLVAHFSGLPRQIVDEIDEADGEHVLNSLADHLAAHMKKLQK